MNKTNPLLEHQGIYSVVQSVEIGLVENQPNTSKRRKEKTNFTNRLERNGAKDKKSNGNRIDSNSVTPTARGQGPASEYSSEATEGDESTLFRKRRTSINLTNRLE